MTDEERVKEIKARLEAIERLLACMEQNPHSSEEIAKHGRDADRLLHEVALLLGIEPVN